MSDDNDSDDYKDPALKNFNRPAFMAKNTVMETLKGALVGALIGAAIALAFVVAVPLIVGGPIGAGVVAAAGALGLSVPAASAIIAPFLIHTAVVGALLGGGLGAVVKGGLGLSNASEAADSEEERLTAKGQQMEALHQNTEARRQRTEAIEQRNQTKLAMDGQTQMLRGANPNQALPRRGAGAMEMEAGS